MRNGPPKDLHTLLLLPPTPPSIRVFSRSQFFGSCGQSFGASASASVFPMTIQDLFPFGLTGLISLQSKGLLMSSSAPQFESINSSSLSLFFFFLIFALSTHVYFIYFFYFLFFFNFILFLNLT